MANENLYLSSCMAIRMRESQVGVTRFERGKKGAGRPLIVSVRTHVFQYTPAQSDMRGRHHVMITFTLDD